MSVRKAAATFHFPKTTVHESFYAPMTPRVSAQHRRALTESEEQRIVSLLLKCSDRSAPLTLHHVLQAIETIVSGMTLSRPVSLPFKDGNPGAKWFRGFMKRHKDTLSFIKPLKQEHERFKAVNADTLCEHFAALERLITENNLDESRIWNLDECGVTPGRDANGRSQQKRILRRNGSQDIRFMPLAYEKRNTFMPVISACGETGPCLFVLKGKSFLYRTVLVSGIQKIDTVANHLPKDAVLTIHEQGGGVDKHNFLEWAYHFVTRIRPLTRSGRKVLLIYDGYRSHMSLSVLRLFAENNVIVYSLPSHCSGKTQPLDMVAFATFKRKLNNIIYSTTEHFSTARATIYDICDMITEAYNPTFTPTLIRSSFLRSGLWPIDSTKLMDVPRPLDETLRAVPSVKHMEKMMEERRVQYATGYLVVAVLDNGYIDTKKGAVLSTQAAIQLIVQRADVQTEAKRKEDLLREQRLQQTAARERFQPEEAQAMKDKGDARRAMMVGMAVGVYKRQLRTLKQRRAAACVRTAEKRLSQGF